MTSAPLNQRACLPISAQCRRINDRLRRPFCPRPGFQKRLCPMSIRPTVGCLTQAQTSPNSSPNCAPKGLRNCLRCPLYSVDNTCAPRLMIPLLTEGFFIGCRPSGLGPRLSGKWLSIRFKECDRAERGLRSSRTMRHRRQCPI